MNESLGVYRDLGGIMGVHIQLRGEELSSRRLKDLGKMLWPTTMMKNNIIRNS